VKDDYREWNRKLAASANRTNLVGARLMLDGGVERIGADKFCTTDVAKSLARQAKQIGGGSRFSVAIVFALQEYKS